VTANPTRPRISAAAVRDAAARLTGTVVLFLEDMTTGPAVYRPRLAAFETTVDGETVISDDDGTLIVLADRTRIDALLDEHGTHGRVAAVLTAELRAGGVL
jgi:hypothetical protein